MAIASDTFVEGVNTALELHTPTGPNAGSGWSIAVANVITVIAAVDKARGIAASGNRYQMDDDLGFDEMDVTLDQNFDVTSAPGDLVDGGPQGRAPAVPAVATYSFVYSMNIGAVFGSYLLQDGSGTDTFEENWGVPTTAKTLLLQLRNNDQRGFADGVEKVSRANNDGVGNVRAGIRELNFSGAGSFPEGDNYLSEGIAPPPPPPVDNPFPEYGQGRAAIGDPSVYGATIVRS